MKFRVLRAVLRNRGEEAVVERWEEVGRVNSMAEAVARFGRGVVTGYSPILELI